MKIMVLNDGETFTNIAGCQIVEVDDSATLDDIDLYLSRLNKDYEDIDNAKIFGGFTEDGTFLIGDPRNEGKKKVIKLDE